MPLIYLAGPSLSDDLIRFISLLAHLTAEQFKAGVDINRVGLIHLSGIEPIHALERSCG